ncbi:MAG TPA: hypothetical protein DD434_09040 [Bacteroidales bacterium]|nr:hypothetical protein [Bacteroidales bacterium]
MKKIFILIALLITTTNLFCQQDTTRVPFVAYWSIGDSYNFKITKTHKEWKKDKVSKDEKNEYTAYFTVIDSTANSYTIRWGFDNYLADSYDIPEEYMKLFEKYDFLEILYTTDETGTFNEILNWEELGKTLSTMIDELVNVLGKDNKELFDILTKTMKPVKTAYITKEGIENLLVPELKIFHFPLGIEIDTRLPFYYVDQLPNLFGGGYIKSNAKLYIDKVDFEENFCVLKQESSLDQNDVKSMLTEFFEKMEFEGKYKDATMVMDTILNNSEITIDDNNIYEYYYYPGIPHRIEVNREVLINMDGDKARRNDKVIIELLYEE